MQHIILVEDDPRLSELVQAFLQQNGFKVTVINRGDTALEQIPGLKADLLVLDIMLPGMDGMALCRAIRPQYSGPILFLTAKDSDFDQVLGLEIGADDYVIKPVEPRVLLARINNLLRRVSIPAEPEADSDELSFDSLHIKLHSRTVSLDGEGIELTSHEFDLLWLLASHAGETKSREFIHEAMIGREYDGLDRTVDVRISRLRKKLRDHTQSPYRIKTIWGKGYLFVPDAWQAA
jgi:two-component system OmpR family response regulator/two-component system response regulator RstA